MTPLRVRLLGEFEVTRDGARVPISSRKAKALFAFLAAEPGRHHGRERLATLLWGDTGEERARHNLRQCVSTLRKELSDTDGSIVVSDGDQLSVDPERVEVDVTIVEAAADPCAGRDQLEAALAACRGRLLADLSLREAPFTDWLDNRRRRLAAIESELSGRLVTMREDAGERRAAIDLAQRRVTLEPCCELAHRELMRLFAHDGRRSDALAQYEVCRELLARHLELEPSSETRAFADRLRAESIACAVPPEPPRTSGAREALPLPDLPAVAVLPFDNVGGDPERLYFSDGVTEQIIIMLSKFRSLFVIGRESSFAFRDRETPVRTIGKQLGVHFVVTGSVQWIGERMRLSARLVDAQNGHTVWAHSYDREPEELFAVQDELTEEIVSTLAGRVEATRLVAARRKPTESLAAYDCLLRGKDYHHRWTLEDNERALGMFRKAADLDPAFAAAHAWVGCALGQRYYFTADVTLAVEARQRLEQARELDDAESECHRMLASFHTGRDYERAEYHMARALELNPNDDRAIIQKAELRVWQGRPDEAIELVHRAMRLNPFHTDSAWFPLAQALFHLGRYDEAVAAVMRINKPGQRHLACLVASAQRAGKTDVVSRHRDALVDARPALTAEELSDSTLEAIAQTMPYVRSEDREALISALRDAGVG